LLLSASAGNDIMFDEEFVTKERFTNKKIGMPKLIKGGKFDTIPQPESSKYAIEWYEAKLQQTLWKSKIILKNTEFDALMGIFKLGTISVLGFRNDKTGVSTANIQRNFGESHEMLENNEVIASFMPF
jgi:valyl-tRNA synthetase